MRGRKAKPIEGIDKHDFDKLARSEGSASERKRFLAFAHIKDGRSFSEAARMVRVQPRTVIVWVKNFRKRGLEGLRQQRGAGAKRLICEEAEKMICKTIDEMQKNRPGGRVRGRDIWEIVNKNYGISLSNGSLYRLLHRAGLSWITGRSQHPKMGTMLLDIFRN
ncbi:helix-turn-helix domain-containing protein [Parachlamydia acanthamoebae]|uniref:helix-turn-helix domain-containing protein n=1 Tax=Parachlamydia acanthamoebae TaxID=83552 RepID=UPI000A7E63B3|nr:helix-turn-helix domain-containing protein [Parachlamydia acanthamoebae]